MEIKELDFWLTVELLIKIILNITIPITTIALFFTVPFTENIIEKQTTIMMTKNIQLWSSTTFLFVGVSITIIMMSIKCVLWALIIFMQLLLGEMCVMYIHNGDGKMFVSKVRAMALAHHEFMQHISLSLNYIIDLMENKDKIKDGDNKEKLQE